VRLQSALSGSTAHTMTSRQLFAVVAVQAHWRGLAGRRGAVRWRRLAELYATEDAIESSTLSRSARIALRNAEAEAAAGEEGAAAALLTSRLLAENRSARWASIVLQAAWRTFTGCGRGSGERSAAKRYRRRGAAMWRGA
jgi:hypothetical protein